MKLKTAEEIKKQVEKGPGVGFIIIELDEETFSFKDTIGLVDEGGDGVMGHNEPRVVGVLFPLMTKPGQYGIDGDKFSVLLVRGTVTVRVEKGTLFLEKVETKREHVGHFIGTTENGKKFNGRFNVRAKYVR